MLGNPVNAVLWLRSKGVELIPGALISVRDFGPLFQSRAGKGGGCVTYEGLPGAPAVSLVLKEFSTAA
ncbi:hypothetical protein AB838_18280 [Rhodobacteraceae bacterium (ex Bugula neritina AB1)]|nr:hypothetical protein AB838_18280 [Rhodobacteraceae bacterium (ex Bugula neritina AB1)]